MRTIGRRQQSIFLISLLILCALVPTDLFSAGQQSSDADAVYETPTLEELLSDSGFQASDQRAIREVFGTARTMGVSDALLLPRLAEAIAKNVPYERLLESLERQLALLVEALAALEEAGLESDQVPDGMLARSANLIGAGFTASQVLVLAQASLDRLDRFRPGSVLLVSLSDWGLEADTAVLLAGSAIRSGIDTQNFPVVLELLVAARRQRVPIDRAAALLQEALAGAETVAQLRGRIPW